MQLVEANQTCGINNEMPFKQVPQAIYKQVECENNKYLK
jgi:hypothetical protein